MLRRTGGRVKAALPVLIVLFTTAVILDGPATGAAGWCGLLAGVVAGAALYGRHRHPERSFAVVALASAVTQLVAPEGLFPYAALMMLWSYTVRRPPTRSLPAMAVVAGLSLVVLPSGVHPTGDVDFAVVVAVTVWALAFARRSHRLMIEQAAARLAVEEHSRLARDIHDVIAHSVSVIVVQAAAADDVFEARPDRAREALRSIESTGRDALTELRRLLADDRRPAIKNPQTSVLEDARARLLGKGHRSGWLSGQGPLAPQPTLDRLRHDVIAPLESAGLTVTMNSSGDLSTVPAGIQLTAFRIVQESLTNALRHGDRGEARVTLARGHHDLTILVRNPGATGRFGSGAGRGVQGMRERAALVGGRLDAAPTGTGDFQVWASLPLTPSGAARPPRAGARA